MATLRRQNRNGPRSVPVTLGHHGARAHLVPMTRALLIAALAAPLLASPAAAQSVRPLPPGPSPWDQHQYQADQHRYEMDRLRLQSDGREATVRQLELETRLNRQQLDSRRTADPYVPSSPPALRSPDEERAARLSATQRRETTSDRVGEIDAWLERRPN